MDDQREFGGRARKRREKATMVESLDLSKLLESQEVPTPPGAALRVLEVKDDPDASIHDLVEVVRQDPGLAVKILSTANSPAYRRGDEVTSIDRAVAMIGFRSVTTIALAFSVASTMPMNGVVGGIPMTTFWKRSVVTAATARLFSEELAPELAEEAFFVGLVAGLGRVVIGMVNPELYEPLANAHDGWPELDTEAAVFDFSSANTTAALLRRWAMPSLFADAVDKIETVSPAGRGSSPEEDIARIVRIAMAVTEFYVGRGDGAALQRLVDHTTEYGIEPDRVHDLLDMVLEHVELLAKQFGVLITQSEYNQIMSRARDELVQMSLQTDAAWQQEVERRSQLERTNIELEQQNREDPLTGLSNRRAFDEQLLQQMTLRIRDPHAMANPIGVIMIDIDFFKKVNDTYGHDAGDAVLKKLAEVLAMTTRTEETVARYGGEEFILLAPLTTPDELMMAAERIRATLELMETQIPSGELIKVTASFGVATLAHPMTRDDAPQLIKAADEALYEAKAAGRNRVQYNSNYSN